MRKISEGREMFTWSSGKKTIFNNEKVIIANIENGKWLRTTLNTYDIVEQIVEENLCIEEIEFEENEDAKYIESVFLALKEIGVLSNAEVKKTNNGKQVSIELTNNCNLSCIHCCVNAGEEKKKDLDTNSIIGILQKCVKWNPEEISLSGGEPLLRKDFFEILMYLRKIYNGHITLSTNGTLIKESNVSKLCDNVDQIDISLDGIDEKTCALVRGAGIFDKVMNSIKLLHTNGFRNISLSMSTIREADYIYVLGDNCIKEEGTHDDLKDKGGLYSKMISQEVC